MKKIVKMVHVNDGQIEEVHNDAYNDGDDILRQVIEEITDEEENYG